MRVYPKSVQEGEVYPTKDGDLVVDKYVSSSEVHITFIKTNYPRTTTAGNIKKGAVKDPYCPSVLGVGYIGVGPHLANSRRTKSSAYTCWNNLIRRCYCPIEKDKQPWYKDCTMAAGWLNFQTFAKWYYENYKEGCELDKDYYDASIKRFKEQTKQLSLL